MDDLGQFGFVIRVRKSVPRRGERPMGRPGGDRLSRTFLLLMDL